MLTTFATLLLGLSGGLVASYFACLKMLRPRWEKKAKKQWYPPTDLGDKLFEKSEEYRKLEVKRMLHDAKRSTLPGADAGRPAKINRMVIRSARSKQQRPN